jgi:hypothetical protein
MIYTDEIHGSLVAIIKEFRNICNLSEQGGCRDCVVRDVCHPIEQLALEFGM